MYVLGMSFVFLEYAGGDVMKTETLLSILLGLLVLVSAVQAYQLGNIKKELSSGNIVSSGASSAQAQPEQSGASQSGGEGADSGIPEDISNSGMVGGC